MWPAALKPDATDPVVNARMLSQNGRGYDMTDTHDDDTILEDPTLEDGPDPRLQPDFWIGALGGGREAREIVQTRAIRESIEAGHFRTLHGLLRARRKQGRGEGMDGRLDEVLADRRLFVDEISGAPGMLTFWGFGTNLHGVQDLDPDRGTFIATYFLTALFVPVWPLKQYLVADAEGGGWHFLAAAPLSPKVRLWRSLAGLSALALLLAIALFAWRQATHDEVHILNGLPEPVTVSLDGESTVVAAGGRVTRHVAAGAHRVRVVTADGRLLETTEIHVDGGQDLAVYNVMGAAPFFLEEHSYGVATMGEKLGDGATYLFLAGERWVSRDKVKHVFEQAPKKVQLDERVKGTTRLVADVLGGGFATSLQRLTASGRGDEAIALARLVAEAFPNEPHSRDVLYEHLVRSAGLEAADELVAAWIKAMPDSVHAHRLYQHHWEARGDTERLREMYGAAHRAAPTDPDTAYLFARIAPPAVARPLLEGMVAKHAMHRWLRRSLAWVTYHEADYVAAAEHYRIFGTLDSANAGYALGVRARCLVALGKRQEALSGLQTFLEGVEARGLATGDGFAGSSWIEIYGLYALLRWREPTDSERPTLMRLLRPQLTAGTTEKVAGSIVAGWARSKRHLKRFSLGAPSDNPAVVQAQLELESKLHPGTVYLKARSTEPEVLTGVDPLAAIAIIASFAAADALDEVEPLIDYVEEASRGLLGREHFEKLPAVGGLDPDLDNEYRAVFLLAASLAAGSEGQRVELLALARRFDPSGRLVPE